MFKTVNRYIYGPTPEERLQEWQHRLRTEQRGLEKEIRQVRIRLHVYSFHIASTF